MEGFWGWEGWNTVSSICQIFLVLSSVASVFITIFQIRNKNRIKVNINLKIREEKEPRNTSRITEFSIFNYGMNGVYIKRCWMGTWKGQGGNEEFIGNKVMIEKLLQPGESLNVDKLLVKELLQSIYSKAVNKKIYKNKMYFYIENGEGKVKRIKTGLRITYDLITICYYMD